MATTGDELPFEPASKTMGHKSNISFAVDRPVVPIIGIGPKSRTVKIIARVHTQCAVRGCCCFTTQRGHVQRTPRPKTYTFCYHHTTLGQRRRTPIPSCIPPIGASSMSSESLLFSRWGTIRYACAEWEGKLKTKALTLRCLKY